MEPLIKSEPCEYLYNEHDTGNQVSSEIRESEIAFQKSQAENNLKRPYGGMEPISSNESLQHPNNSDHQSFEIPSVFESAQNSNKESIQTTMTSEGKPNKRYKRLEENALFNPPFFNLVEELLTSSNKDAIAAKCYSCNKIVKGNRGISSNFIKHMKRGHPEMYKLYDDYKSNRIKSYHLPRLAKLVANKSSTAVENGASGSDSTAANSNDDTNQCFEVSKVQATASLNYSSDDNEDSVLATKEVAETSKQFKFSAKNFEDLGNLIDEKLKTFVKQKEYEQLNEKLNALTDGYKTCDARVTPVITELKAELDNLKKECIELRTAVHRNKASKRQLLNELQAVDRLLYQRKLIIKNIPVCNSEDPLKSVQKLFTETMHLEDIKIVNCCIIPSAKTSETSIKETVSIELARLQDCKAVFRHTQSLKNTGIFIESEISPYQRKRKNKLMVLRKELLRRKPDLKVLVRSNTLVVNGKKFYWDDVEGLCHECQQHESVELNGVEYLKLLCGVDLKEFTVVLQNYNVQII